KSGCLASDLRVARANTAKCCAPAPTTNEDVAIRVHVECSIFGRIWNDDRRLPRGPTVCGALESKAGAVTASSVICLVLETMPRAVRLIDSEPLLIAAAPAPVGRQLRPGLTTIDRGPQIVTEE